MQGTLSSPQDEGGEPALTLPLSVLLSNSHQHPPSPPRLQGRVLCLPGGSLERRSLLLLKKTCAEGQCQPPTPSLAWGWGSTCRISRRRGTGGPCEPCLCSSAERMESH